MVWIYLQRYKRVIMAVFAISAIAHMAIAIASPYGITYYENNLIIKYSEIIVSVLIIILFLKDIVDSIRIGDNNAKQC